MVFVQRGDGIVGERRGVQRVLITVWLVGGVVQQERGVVLCKGDLLRDGGLVLVRAAHVVLEEEVELVKVGEYDGDVVRVGSDGVDGVEAVGRVGVHVAQVVDEVAAVVGVEAVGEDGGKGAGGVVVAEEEVAVQVVDLGHTVGRFVGEVEELGCRGVALVAVVRGAVKDDAVGFHAGGELGEIKVEDVARGVDGDVVLYERVVAVFDDDAKV